MSGLKSLLDGKPWLKNTVHRLLIPKGQARPRWTTRVFINPWVHRRGRGAKVAGSARLDLFPFNRFELGAGSTVEDFVTLNNGVGDLCIGDNTRIGISNVLIAPVRIGNNCILAQNIVISGLNHGYENPDLPIKDQPVSKKEIVIEDDCWIGANVSIAAGVTVGKHAVVGAGSVVTKSVPPFHIAVGNPAKVIKKYDFAEKKWVKV
ncbi:putative acetyl transferase [Chloroherpeton thalassium ATCC 35110]|uniref:Putative acetyl transferase n=1 Tax=Chloroherpeton thalassium (strain ATCC 35110 / GB-78) TaxID=517418 RepID=B3QU54_CHLT3|nr:acyltransferase [Chloroherpeton thalassium]ACF12852.1 putative acetyl transferase [Chloroherpeton thalassium ATCC 35110]